MKPVATGPEMLAQLLFQEYAGSPVDRRGTARRVREELCGRGGLRGAEEMGRDFGTIPTGTDKTSEFFAAFGQKHWNFWCISGVSGRTTGKFGPLPPFYRHYSFLPPCQEW